MSQHRLANDLSLAHFPTAQDVFYVPDWSGHVFAWGDTAARSTYPTSSTANMRFLNTYFTSSATSGTSRGWYHRLYLSGGAGGEALRVFTTCSDDTPADTCNGAHISMNYGSSAGNCTGLATAVRGTLHVPNRTLGGTAAGVQAELYADGSSSAADASSLVRCVIDGDSTGKAALEDSAFLFDISTGTNASGNMVSAAGNEPTWNSATYKIRCRANGTTIYLVAVAA